MEHETPNAPESIERDLIAESISEVPPSTEALKSLMEALPREVDTYASQDVQKGLEQLELRREATRDILARRMLYLLGGSLLCSFLILAGAVFIEASDKETAKDLVALILTSQTGLVGTVLGFYFGSQK